MNYSHKYHAGNFADIVKHYTLISTIEYYKNKNKPIIFFDSHAGYGLYDLNSPEANRSGEASFGVKSVFDKLEETAPVYYNIIKNYNENKLRYYPGSSLIISHLMREIDRAFFIDSHKPAIDNLIQYKKPNIILHNRDGFEAIKALLPTTEKRGVIIIDPAFEKHKDFESIKSSVSYLLKSFSNGTIIIWYPVKEIDIKDELIKITETNKKQYLNIRTKIMHPDFQFGMNLCDTFVINPTMHLKNDMTNLKETLINCFYDLDIKGNC